MFLKFIMLESKRIQCKRPAVILGIFVCIVCLFLQSGINQYKHTIEETRNFHDFEAAKVKQLVYWVQYGDYGVRLLFVPSHLMAFYDAGPVPNLLTGYIDTSERMAVYKPMMGINALSGFITEYMNFLGFVFFIGSFLAMLFGYTTTNNHDWLIFLEGIIKSRKKLLIYLGTARILILFCFCTLLMLISMLFFLINGLPIDEYFFILFPGIFLMMLFFLVFGFLWGFAKNKFTGVMGVIMTWFFLVLLLPWMISKWNYNQSDNIKSIYQVEAQKQKSFMEYEKSALEKGGKFDPSKRGTEQEKQMFLDFWDNGFKRVMEYEQKMLEDIKSDISIYQNLSALCPSTSFILFCNEISSKGLKNLVGFHEYTQKMKSGFFWFFAHNYILSNKKEIASFIKSDENLFQGKSTLPDNTGVIFSFYIIWMVFLSGAAWFYFNRMLNGKKAEKQSIEIKPDDFKTNKATVLLTSNPAIYQGLMSMMRFQKINFIDVPSPDNIPGDIDIKTLFSFFSVPVPGKLEYRKKPVSKLSPDQKAFALTEIIKSQKTDIIIFHGFLDGLSDSFQEYFSKFIKEIKQGRKVVYITNSIISCSSFDMDDVIRFTKEKLL